MYDLIPATFKYAKCVCVHSFWEIYELTVALVLSKLPPLKACVRGIRTFLSTPILHHPHELLIKYYLVKTACLCGLLIYTARTIGKAKICLFVVRCTTSFVLQYTTLDIML